MSENRNSKFENRNSQADDRPTGHCLATPHSSHATSRHSRTTSRHSRAKLALSLSKGGNPLWLVLPFAAILLASSPASSQVATGLPPFGSFSGGPDIVNNANLNVHLQIPILTKAGRGLAFYYALTYESAVWYPSSAGGTNTWTPMPNWGWLYITSAALGERRT